MTDPLVEKLEKRLWLDRAREQYQEMGTLEIDDNAEVSASSEGAWVAAWVWVPEEADDV